jgi:riboflavin synthase
MFTGIVEEAGVVRAIRPSAKSIELVIQAHRCARGLKRGDSVAVNGCCLTAVKLTSRGRGKFVQFDLLRETWERTNLQHARSGTLVNLELPLRADGRFDGHFVTGHVDAVGKIVRWERAGRDHLLEISAPAEVMRYVVPKGSIAVDGISLTVGRVTTKSFGIWIIPHTLKVTALRERQVGDAVNLEADILGKHVEQFVRRSRKTAQGARNRK